MSFRIVEISKPAEIHIKNRQLEAIGEVCESLKRIVGENSDEDLHLPDILPTELLDRITE